MCCYVGVGAVAVATGVSEENTAVAQQGTSRTHQVLLASAAPTSAVCCCVLSSATLVGHLTAKPGR